MGQTLYYFHSVSERIKAQKRLSTFDGHRARKLQNWVEQNGFSCLVFVLVTNYLRHSIYEEERFVSFTILEVQRCGWHWQLPDPEEDLLGGCVEAKTEEVSQEWRNSGLLKYLPGSWKKHLNRFGERDLSLSSKSHTTPSPRDMALNPGGLGETTSPPPALLWLKAVWYCPTQVLACQRLPTSQAFPTSRSPLGWKNNTKAQRECQHAVKMKAHCLLRPFCTHRLWSKAAGCGFKFLFSPLLAPWLGQNTYCPWIPLTYLVN